MDQEPEDVVQPSMPRPRPADWLWRPWYAKLWWSAAAIFWTLAALDSFVLHRVLTDRANDGLFYPFVLLFHPFVIVPVLSFGFVRAWLAFVGREEPTDGQSEPRHGGSRSIYPEHIDPTDPLDPRFITHPANPMSPMWRDRHLLGRD